MKDSKNGKRLQKKKQRTNSKGWLTRQKALELSVVVLFGLFTSLTVESRWSIQFLTGGFLISTLLFLIFYRDIIRYKPDYIKNMRMLLLLGFLVIFTIINARAFQYFFQKFSEGLGVNAIESIIYGMPIPVGAILVTLIFDFHTAIIFSFTLSLLTGLWVGESLYPIYAFVGSLTGAFSVIRCKKRSDILKSGLYVSGANVFTLTGLLLYTNRFTDEFAPFAYIFAIASGIVVSAIVSLVLPAIEMLFKVTTDITLLELLDLNQPLMKNLMITAPGTYHHSIIVGNLVESVAEDIGVNPLMARVCAYYHDIGKIKMPEYFVENQTGAVSKHDRLTPHMSSIILSSHVKEGVEIAREYKLPEPIIDIIQQHHGTCLMTYFYQKAKDLGDGEPTEEDYRYQGPKPQSRLAALVMIADAVEAASRVLKDPTPARIESLVDKIVNHIFIDGQLEECELTLKDISLIKRKFTYILTGILHKRVDYPGFDFGEKTEEKKEQVETTEYTDKVTPLRKGIKKGSDYPKKPPKKGKVKQKIHSTLP
ncbi:MAG: HDIG domain-containing protein [Nitrospirae bacterium]|nr:HDIG domain-containing protein [Nitrospirota bacterium]